MNPLGLASLPADVVGALRLLPALMDRLDAIAESTAPLPEVRDAILGVSRDAAVLPAMDDRMATIESAMPVLVEVQQHLARLPETIETLGEGVTRLSDLLGQLLTSLDRLDENVTALHGSVEPLGRIANRLPGGNRG